MSRGRRLGEVLETDDAYQVKVELPGLHADQIGVELNNRELVVNGASTRVEEAGVFTAHAVPGPSNTAYTFPVTRP